jgi:hypothetical protein
MYGRTAAGLGVGLVLGMLGVLLLFFGYAAFGITILVISTLIVLVFISTRRSGSGGVGYYAGGLGGAAGEGGDHGNGSDGGGDGGFGGDGSGGGGNDGGGGG